MNETMTVQQVIEISINNLNAIQLPEMPIGLARQICEPILGVVNNLQLCLDAMKKSQEQENTEVIDPGEIGGEEDGSVPDAE